MPSAPITMSASALSPFWKWRPIAAAGFRQIGQLMIERDRPWRHDLRQYLMKVAAMDVEVKGRRSAVRSPYRSRFAYIVDPVSQARQT